MNFKKLVANKHMMKYLLIAAVVLIGIFYLRLKYTDGFASSNDFYIAADGSPRTIPVSALTGKGTLSDIQWSTYNTATKAYVPLTTAQISSIVDATATKISYSLPATGKVLKKPQYAMPATSLQLKMPAATTAPDLAKGITMTNLNTGSFGTLQSDPVNKDFATSAPANVKATLVFT